MPDPSAFTVVIARERSDRGNPVSELCTLLFYYRELIFFIKNSSFALIVSRFGVSGSMRPDINSILFDICYGVYLPNTIDKSSHGRYKIVFIIFVIYGRPMRHSFTCIIPVSIIVFPHWFPCPMLSQK